MVLPLLYCLGWQSGPIPIPLTPGQNLRLRIQVLNY